MSATIDEDSDGQDLDTIIHSINKEIEEVTLCLTDGLGGDDDEESVKLSQDDIKGDVDKQYYLDEGGNLFLTLTSSKSDDMPSGTKRKAKPLLGVQAKRKGKSSTTVSGATNTGKEKYMVYIPAEDIKTENEQTVEDPAAIDEIYEFDELEEQSGSQEEEGEQFSLLKVFPVKNKESAGGTVQYSCPHCDYQADKRFLLSRHMKRHSDDRPFICSVCDRGFKTNHTLQNHINVHLGRRPHACLSCESRFTTPGDLARHVRYKHTHEKRHKCTECDYATVEMSKLQRHMRAHTGERPYQCPHCTYASPDSFKLKRHLRTHTGEKPYECDICKSRFTQSNSLKSHKLIHSVDDKPVFQCALCPTTCSRKSDLRIHVKKLHYSDHPIPCTRCGKELPDRYSYKMHVKTHEGERCYSCDQCNYKSISMRNLEMHKQIHSDVKPFKCDQCGQTFRQKQLLGRHTNLYHNENYTPPPKLKKTHTCPYCKRAFAHKGNLVRHMKLHDAADKESKTDRMSKLGDDNLFDIVDPYMTDENDEENDEENDDENDDDATNDENFEVFGVIEEMEESENDFTIETVEPTTSKAHIQNKSTTAATMAKGKGKGKNIELKVESIRNEDENSAEDDVSGLPNYMVVKVLETDDELDDEDGDCVILTNLDNIKDEKADTQSKLNMNECFGFEEDSNNDDIEESVLLDIVEEN
ncbi:transcriptional repressor CTCF isoform X2 [Bactrocera oleae]|uniref:transcriptional repressor CTCF isoform X2 n=1 Tax=Bactrocera oleae TaxID=104688 RepID=UPI00387E566E